MLMLSSTEISAAQATIASRPITRWAISLARRSTSVVNLSRSSRPAMGPVLFVWLVQTARSDHPPPIKFGSVLGANRGPIPDLFPKIFGEIGQYRRDNRPHGVAQGAGAACGVAGAFASGPSVPLA